MKLVQKFNLILLNIVVKIFVQLFDYWQGKKVKVKFFQLSDETAKKKTFVINFSKWCYLLIVCFFLFCVVHFVLSNSIFRDYVKLHLCLSLLNEWKDSRCQFIIHKVCNRKNFYY